MEEKCNFTVSCVLCRVRSPEEKGWPYSGATAELSTGTIGIIMQRIETKEEGTGQQGRPVVRFPQGVS